MITEGTPRQAEARNGLAVCANEGCARPARPGEEYCDACGLELLLYRRDLRAPSGRPPNPPR